MSEIYKDEGVSVHDQNALRPAFSFDLQKYKTNNSINDALIIVGAPFISPIKKDKIVISPTLFSENKIFYEFDMKDIITWEEIDKIVNSKGTTITLIKLYIKKGTIGIRYEPVLFQ
ncbi:MAG: hypothetical protein NUV32_07835 [Exilispira sp.]|jgi:inorganic pyrophosphatase|nr:hypothetical protein [Exilispira sp.]